MWTPNSTQIPSNVITKALHGEIPPETLLAVAAFMTFPKWSGTSLMEQFSLSPESVEAAENLLQIGSIEMEERDESPSTPIEEETHHESDFIRDSILGFFPDASISDKQIEDLSKYSEDDVYNAIFVIHAGHLENGNVYEPMGLLFWTLKNRTSEKLAQQVEIIKRKPRSQGSILGEALEKAKRNAPPKPGPTPEKVEEMKRRNEAVRSGKPQ